jgi:hypothetical protein
MKRDDVLKCKWYSTALRKITSTVLLKLGQDYGFLSID